LEDYELWKIYDYDEEFQAIESKIKLINSIYEGLCNNNSEAKEDRSVTETLKKIDTMEKAQDLLEYIQIVYGDEAEDEIKSDEKSVKRPIRGRFYSKMKKAGVGEFVKVIYFIFILFYYFYFILFYFILFFLFLIYFYFIIFYFYFYFYYILFLFLLYYISII